MCAAAELKVGVARYLYNRYLLIRYVVGGEHNNVGIYRNLVMTYDKHGIIARFALYAACRGYRRRAVVIDRLADRLCNDIGYGTGILIRCIIVYDLPQYKNNYRKHRNKRSDTDKNGISAAATACRIIHRPLSAGTSLLRSAGAVGAASGASVAGRIRSAALSSSRCAALSRSAGLYVAALSHRCIHARSAARQSGVLSSALRRRLLRRTTGRTALVLCPAGM